MKEKPVAFGTGNVFADLGLPDAEEHLAKADLVSKIASVIATRKLTQVEAAAIMGIPQSKVSLLVRGRFKDFSIDRLCRLLNKLGINVSLVLTDAPRRKAGVTTVQALEDNFAKAFEKVDGTVDPGLKLGYGNPSRRTKAYRPMVIDMGKPVVDVTKALSLAEDLTDRKRK